jgi:hypothetical protein
MGLDSRFRIFGASLFCRSPMRPRRLEPWFARAPRVGCGRRSATCTLRSRQVNANRQKCVDALAILRVGMDHVGSGLAYPAHRPKPDAAQQGKQRAIQCTPSARPRATPVPGQDQRLACESLGPERGDFPIDAQPPGTNGFGRAAGRNDREDFRPSSIGRTRSGLREPPRPETSARLEVGGRALYLNLRKDCRGRSRGLPPRVSL